MLQKNAFRGEPTDILDTTTSMVAKEFEVYDSKDMPSGCLLPSLCTECSEKLICFAVTLIGVSNDTRI